MNVVVGICTDDARKISKNVTGQKTISCTIKENLDLHDPIFYVNYDASIIDYNYCMANGKSYFMKIQTEPGGAMRLICTEDVLNSFATGILNAKATALRSYSQYDGKFNDPKYPVIQRKSIETVPLFKMSESESIIFGWIE